MRYQQLSVLAATVLATALPFLAGAQTQQQGGAMDEKGTMSHSCRAMMASHQKTDERMQAMDAELDRLVAEMEAATGEEKIGAVAAVVSELVEQREAMHAIMTQRSPMMMMRHMMEHMHAGEGMMDCPMMQEAETGKEGEPEPAEHSAHLPD